MQLVDDPALLPAWLPRPGASTVADHVPLGLYPELVRLPFLHDPRNEDPTWPEPLRSEWASLRLCDVLDAPAPFDEGPTDQQLAALLPLLLAEDQRFWFLAAEGTDEVESFGSVGSPSPGTVGSEVNGAWIGCFAIWPSPPARSPRMPKCPGSGWRAVADHRRLSWRYNRSQPPTCGPTSGCCGCTDGATTSNRC